MRPALLLLTPQSVVSPVEIADHVPGMTFAQHSLHHRLPSALVDFVVTQAVVRKTPQPPVVPALTPPRLIGVQIAFRGKLKLQVLIERIERFSGSIQKLRNLPR